jgi:type I restriction enzyme, R subunit
LNVPKCIIEKNEPAVFSIEDEYEAGSKTAAAQADAIAHATKRITSENMEFDKEFYKTFATLIQQVIDDFRAQRLSDLAYLEKAKEVYNKVVNKIHDDVPEVLQGNEDAMAYYGDVKAIFKSHYMDKEEEEAIVAEIAIEINKIVVVSHKVDFWNDDDAKKELENEIDDYLYDVVKGEKNIDLTLEQMDQIIKDTLNTARVRKSK